LEETLMKPHCLYCGRVIRKAEQKCTSPDGDGLCVAPTTSAELDRALKVLAKQPPPPPSTAAADEHARRIGAQLWAVRDALGAATSIAGRGSDLFSGTEAAVLFNDGRNAIASLIDHPAFKALLSAAIPPSRLKGGE
jgi:hypothetical protein